MRQEIRGPAGHRTRDEPDRGTGAKTNPISSDRNPRVCNKISEMVTSHLSQHTVSVKYEIETHQASGQASPFGSSSTPQIFLRNYDAPIGWRTKPNALAWR
jgi:hypothetical protein